MGFDLPASVAGFSTTVVAIILFDSGPDMLNNQGYQSHVRVNEERPQRGKQHEKVACELWRNIVGDLENPGAWDAGKRQWGTSASVLA